MNIIRILPEKTASQIAAGEVIDRPASVMRELIDNSIDAGADRIIIRIESGGKGLIKVIDNGKGMSRDDLLLCVERHATSKIETAEDLFSVKSLGFRGEALPSIASVSRMQITSRIHDRIGGFSLKIAGGKLISIDETGTPPGTIVEVRNLFYNIPARRKFLKGIKTETNYIIDTISRMSLPYPEINFRIEDTGRTIINFPASDKQIMRVSALMGRNVAGSMVHAKIKKNDFDISVYLAPSDLARKRGDRLFVYANKRSIKDRLVTKAVIEGYGQRLMKGTYPQAVIFIEIDPLKVDINVHPAKQEVRFHNPGELFKAIVSCIEKTLTEHFHTSAGPLPWDMTGKMNHDFQAQGNIADPFSEYISSAQSLKELPAEDSTGAMFKQGPQVIGQLGNTYILCQEKDGLIVIDQHAAHERIMYEKFKKGFLGPKIEVQTLLTPYKLEMTIKETRILLQKGPELSDFGIEIDHFGGNTFLLRSAPAILCENVHWDSFISELISELDEKGLDKEVILDKVLILMACHSAIRAGYHMTYEEMTRLINRLTEMDLPTNCPHGRPTFRRLTYYELEKMFKRVV